jgi:cysteine synthase A
MPPITPRVSHIEEETLDTKFDNILATIGKTPVVKINKLAPAHTNLYVKLEAFNPGGSVKDRLALGVILDAEEKGLLKPGQTVVEATSGNTGIGLALVCAQRGYPLVIVMAENFSIERRKMMRFFGARVILTPAAMKGSGMLAKASELAVEHGWFLTRQFDNQANADIHSRTTAVEILNDFASEQLDYWVTGFGTGGTLNGVSKVLREKSPHTSIVVCEPDNSQLLGSNTAQPTPDNINDPTPSHPAFRPHAMQGWTPDFISKLTGDAVANKNIDRLVAVAGKDALFYASELARKEGIFTGITGGATFAGAMHMASEAPEGSTLLCMLPDTGERYLSTPLFDDIDSEMNDVELEIARSTPNYRFDVSPTTTPAPTSNPDTQPDLEMQRLGQQLFDNIMQRTDKPVVMFALQWCEFCWAVRKLLDRLKIPFLSVDLDSVELQTDETGAKIRMALLAKTGVPTIPQIFVGKQLVGGCTELFDIVRSRQLHSMLSELGQEFDAESEIDPADFLPNWLAR